MKLNLPSVEITEARVDVQTHPAPFLRPNCAFWLAYPPESSQRGIFPTHGVQTLLEEPTFVEKSFCEVSARLLDSFPSEESYQVIPVITAGTREKAISRHS